MTERIIIAAVFLSLALILSIYSNSFVSNVSEDMLETAQRAKTEIAEEDTNAVEELLKLWEDNKDGFAVFLKHADADTMDRYFLVLKQSYEAGDVTQMNIALRDLSAFIRVTSEGEKLKIKNIF